MYSWVRRREYIRDSLYNFFSSTIYVLFSLSCRTEVLCWWWIPYCCGLWWLFSWGQGVLYHHENFTTPTFTSSLIHLHALKLSIHNTHSTSQPAAIMSAFPLSLQCLCPSPSPSPPSYWLLGNFLCVREPPVLGMAESNLGLLHGSLAHQNPLFFNRKASI